MKNQLFQVLVALYRLQRRITKARAWVSLESLARRAYWKSRLANFGHQTGIFRDVVIHHPQSVSIGDRCSIAEFVHIWGGGGVEIGNNVLVASHVAITSMTHDVEAVIFGETSVKKAVVIEDNVWIGAGAVILPGVRLGTGCVVGAGAVVTKDVSANSIVVGIPAQKIRQLVQSSERHRPR